jgi:hypothetical protein
MKAVLEVIALVALQVFLFSISTTGLVVQGKGRGRLPPLAEQLAKGFDMRQGRLLLVGELFWLVIALALLIGVAVDGLRLSRSHEVLASGFALLIDALWVTYLVSQPPQS